MFQTHIEHVAALLLIRCPVQSTRTLRFTRTVLWVVAGRDTLHTPRPRMHAAPRHMKKSTTRHDRTTTARHCPAPAVGHAPPVGPNSVQRWRGRLHAGVTYTALENTPPAPPAPPAPPPAHGPGARSAEPRLDVATDARGDVADARYGGERGEGAWADERQRGGRLWRRLARAARAVAARPVAGSSRMGVPSRPELPSAP